MRFVSSAMNEQLPMNRMNKSNAKIMLTVFFDCEEVVHHEFAPQGQSVTWQF